MILFRHLGKSLDILLGDLNVCQPRVLLDKVFQGLLFTVDD